MRYVKGLKFYLFLVCLISSLLVVFNLKSIYAQSHLRDINEIELPDISPEFIKKTSQKLELSSKVKLLTARKLKIGGGIKETNINLYLDNLKNLDRSVIDNIPVVKLDKFPIQKIDKEILSRDGCSEVQIDANTQVNGVLEAGDCTLADLFGDTSYANFLADLYIVSLSTQSDFTIGLESSQFDAYLGLFSATTGELITEDDDSGGGTNAQITANNLPAGEYYIIASPAQENQSGAYTLTTSTNGGGGGGECSEVQIDANTQVNGVLEAGDCTLADLFGDTSYANFLADLYIVSLSTQSDFTIGLESSQFDAYLGLFSATTGELITEDDDSGGGANAQITVSNLPAGEYYIIASPAQENQSGAYTLTTSTNGGGGGGCNAVQIDANTQVNGVLEAGDCTLADLLGDQSYANFLADLYVVSLPSQGDFIISLESNKFDAYLGLFSATGQFITEDNDSGGGTNAQITVNNLPAGDYLIIVNPAQENQSGAYRLLTSTNDLGLTEPTVQKGIIVNKTKAGKDKFVIKLTNLDKSDERSSSQDVNFEIMLSVTGQGAFYEGKGSFSPNRSGTKLKYKNGGCKHMILLNKKKMKLKCKRINFGEILEETDSSDIEVMIKVGNRIYKTDSQWRKKSGQNGVKYKK
jgi:hypothetical protein